MCFFSLLNQTHPKLQRHTGAIPAIQEQHTRKFVPSRWGWPPFDLLSRAVQIRVGLELADLVERGP